MLLKIISLQRRESSDKVVWQWREPKVTPLLWRLKLGACAACQPLKPSCRDAVEAMSMPCVRDEDDGVFVSQEGPSMQWAENKPYNFCLYLRQTLTEFWHFFTGTVNQKNRSEAIIKYPTTSGVYFLTKKLIYFIVGSFSHIYISQGSVVMQRLRYCKNN